jgi:hypothetical protein
MIKESLATSKNVRVVLQAAQADPTDDTETQVRNALLTAK